MTCKKRQADVWFSSEDWFEGTPKHFQVILMWETWKHIIPEIWKKKQITRVQSQTIMLVQIEVCLLVVCVCVLTVFQMIVII